MRAWEKLLRTHAGTNRISARYAAHGLADKANEIGMFISDSLELMLTAAESAIRGSTKDDRWDDLRSGKFKNQANGINLDWMPEQFTKHELVYFGRAGVRFVGLDPDDWGIEEGSEAHGVGYVQGPLESTHSHRIDLTCDDLGVMGQTQDGESISLAWSDFVEYWEGDVRFPDFMPVESGTAIVLIPDTGQTEGRRSDLVVYPDDLEGWLRQLDHHGIARRD
ncbi:MAG: hypothetical protein ACLFRT_09460 [Actinomycetota bacterium]